MPGKKTYVDIFDDRNKKGNYTYKKKSGVSYNDDNSFDYSSGYSSMHRHRSSYVDTLSAVRAGFQLALSYAPIMGLSRSIKVVVDPKESSYNAVEKKIRINTQVYSEQTMTIPQKHDVFIGEFLHEVCHYKWTDFPDFHDWISKLSPRKGILPPKVTPKQAVVLKTLWNIIEDERIERVLGEDYPGYIPYIANLKNYFYSVVYQRILDERLVKQATNVAAGTAVPDVNSKAAATKAGNKAANYIDVFLNVVRYPANLSDEDLEVFESFIDKAKGVLTPYPQSTQESIDAAERIYKLIEEEIHDDWGDIEDEEEKKATTIYILMELFEDSAEDLFKIIASGEDKNLEENIPDSDKACVEAMVLINRAVEDVCEFGTKRCYTFYKVAPNKSVYREQRDKLKGKQKVLSSLLEREHRDQRLILNGMKTGILDTNKIAEFLSGAENIYTQYKEVKTKKVKLCLLFDQSSSMESEYGSNRNSYGFFNNNNNNYNNEDAETKASLAQQSGIMIAEAVTSNPDVELYMYGYHSEKENGSDGTTIYIYREPDYNKQFTLGNMQFGYYTHEGRAIEEVATRIRKHTSDNFIFIVISDGTPEGSRYSGASAISHTRSVVKKITKDGFEVIHLCIDEQALKKSKEMYDHTINFTDMKDLPRAMAGLMKTLIRKNTRV